MRTCQFQGSWYPPRPGLEEQIRSCLAPEPDPSVCFAIAPHAGLSYSLRVQISALRRIDPSRFYRVVILTVCHHFRLTGLAQTPFKQWENPLDGSAIPVVTLDGVPLAPQEECIAEHSAELLLPALCTVYRQHKFAVSVVFCGSRPNPSDIKLLPLPDDAFYLISSDFCHYGRAFRFAPVFDNMTAQQTADALNDRAVRALYESSSAFAQEISNSGNTVCGRYTIETGLALFEACGKYQAEVTARENSNAVKSAADRSVSYVGIVGRRVSSQ